MNIIQKILFPPVCPLCDAMTVEPLLCNYCYQELSLINKACTICAIPIIHANICGACLKQKPFFDTLICPCLYKNPLTHIIHQFKYSKKLYFARILSQLLLEKLCAQNNFKLPDCIIPVPLHRSRQRERGFNQSVEIAKPIAKYLNIHLDSTSIIRHKKTQSQSQLNAKQRIRNIVNAFSCRKTIDYQHVAVIDDVVTSGQTVNELSKLLRKYGVKTIQIWCVARTEH